MEGIEEEKKNLFNEIIKFFTRNLQFYLNNGMVLKKVHRVLQFSQSAWLKPYIELNTKLRQSADNKFEEGFAKLMNNSFFGESC